MLKIIIWEDYFEHFLIYLHLKYFGEVQEWLIWHAWKACVRESVPWVRIPLSPQLVLFYNDLQIWRTAYAR